MEEQDDFFKHIKEVLHHHEEGYREGAWEDFAGQHLKPSPSRTAPVVSIWKWAAAAAILTGVCFAAFYFINFKAAPPAGNVVQAPVSQPQNTRPSDDSSITPQQQLPETAPVKEYYSSTEKNDPDNYNLSVTTPSAGNTIGAPVLYPATVPGTAPLIPTPAPPVAGKPAAPKPSAPVHFWENRIITEEATQPPRQAMPVTRDPVLARNSEQKESGRSKRWSLGLFLSPTFGETNVNMGYGASLGYAINDKIRISTGIAHNKLTASRDFDVAASPPPASLNSPVADGLFAARGLLSNSNTTSQPQLEAVKGAVSGFDIPVDISYNISKKLYASAGVSGLVVIKDNAQYTYVTSTNQRVQVENSQGLLKEDKNMRVVEYSTSDAAPEASGKEKTPFLGFYNVSMGYKQRVSSKNNVAIEPFLKIPMKSVSDQKLNYTGVGIRLKFDF
ncbi:hypothetical protein [Niabella beijingensis]|uniref:hypothetical protein n=1 Tax=Niabella beijingensis TaxID=2872700 RepID=UPI001CC15550|nr:hypothetical protein [Niabella beijingensis]MBZ4192126.1 hypothetical protein [Niabella beijingensis]